MGVIVKLDGQSTCHRVNVVVIGNGLVNRLQHDHDGTFAFDEAVKRKR